MAAENRAFQLMINDAVTMLEGKEPAEIAKNTGIIYDADQNLFTVQSLGKDYTISYPDYRCMEEIDEWQYLSILHYMTIGDGAPVLSKEITMGQMPSGLIRGGNFDRTAANGLENFVKRHTEEEVQSFFEHLDAEILDGKADLSVRLYYLPKVPLTINIWFADEEFPPSARLLVDESVSHYLTIEDMVTVGEYILRLLND